VDTLPKVFLSPSTQEWNKYVNGGTEEQYMNILADYMEPLLQATGIDYVRNDPSRNVLGAIEDSNAGQYDVHLALHTNAAGGNYSGRMQGVDVYYSPYSDFSEKLADIIADNMKNGVYPDPSKVKTEPTTSLAEVNRTKAISVLAELGYHDNVQDAEWIKNNIPQMAEALVKSLAQYFGIPFINGGEPRYGTVTTDGSNLNIRKFPAGTAAVVGTIPSGATVTVLGDAGDWYVVNYNGQNGYSAKSFISMN
jgi:N-acetylmuramoyl-L-alanine amidase